jgi:hypothetical protein
MATIIEMKKEPRRLFELCALLTSPSLRTHECIIRAYECCIHEYERVTHAYECIIDARLATDSSSIKYPVRAHE